MTQLKRQIIAVIAAGSATLNLVGPAFAAELTITGNGSSSDNTISVEKSNDTTVVQSNTAVVNNTVSSNATTGGNRANDNTNGDVMIRTGNATTATTIENNLNSNVAQVDCCEESDLDVLISGNGSHSDNEVEVGGGRHHSSDETQIFQNNAAAVTNSVNTDAKTGGNDAKRNTGGDVTVRTGDATATVEVSTTANANVAQVGGGNGESGEVSARIVGNGSYSDNDIDLEFDRDTTIVQDNLATVLNGVYANAKTGYNDANDNTGGEVVILTGDADAEVVIDNLVNFNSADIDCGCLFDLDAKISENGYNTDNKIKADFDGDREVYQGGEEGNGNVALLTNGVEADAKTGVNESDYNTGESGDDPFIWTGDAWSSTEVANAGNVNVYGGMADWEWPDFEWDFNFAHMFAH